MYKNRITQWGLDKKHKEDEMKAIVRKIKQRADLGKKSVSIIRGRTIEHQELVRYLKRKHLTIQDVLSERQTRATPEAVECRTPSPRAIASPDIFANPERIFRSIQDYTRGSFENGTWLTCGQEYRCYSSKTRSQGNIGLLRLYGDLQAVCALYKRDNAQEAELLLISATAGMKIVLMAEDPQLLHSIFAIILRLDINSGCELEIGLSILKCLSSFGEVVLGREHPVVRISGWLASVHARQLHSVAVKAFEVIVDHFSSILGPMHRSTLDARLFNIVSVDTHHDEEEEVHQVRDLLEECDRTFGFDDPRISTIRWVLAHQLEAMEDYQGAERICRDMMRHEFEVWSLGLRPQNEVVNSNCLYVLAYSQWGQQDKASAVRSMMDSINRLTPIVGKHEGRIRMCMIQLEEWLVDMGDLVGAAIFHERSQEILTSWRIEEETAAFDGLESRE